MTPEMETKVLSLNPEAISEKEVAEVLSKCPAPKVFCFDGSIPIVTMNPLAGSWSVWAIQRRVFEIQAMGPILTAVTEAVRKWPGWWPGIMRRKA